MSYIFNTVSVPRECLKDVIVIAEDVCLHAKALGADVYGEYVMKTRFLILQANIDINSIFTDNNVTIDIRMDNQSIKFFIPLLSLKYRLYHVKSSKPLPEPWMMVYRVQSFMNPQVVLNMNIVAHARSFWSLFASAIDVFCIMENSTSLQVCHQHNLLHVVDKIGHIRGRTLVKHFCFTVKPNNSMQYVANVARAAELVRDGWVMDNWIMDPVMDAPIVNMWKNHSCPENDSYICPLCQENMKDTDIVVRTTCNHFFHWKCPGSENGLWTWIYNSEKNSCPTCRCLLVT